MEVLRIRRIASRSWAKKASVASSERTDEGGTPSRHATTPMMKTPTLLPDNTCGALLLLPFRKLPDLPDLPETSTAGRLRT